MKELMQNYICFDIWCRIAVADIGYKSRNCSAVFDIYLTADSRQICENSHLNRYINLMPMQHRTGMSGTCEMILTLLVPSSNFAIK